MKENRGIVFLSHSSDDKQFVGRVKAKLDNSALFYDIESIAPGSDSIDAMERGVEGASVFVLFHSTSSLAGWVGFEKDLARLAKIQSPSMQILVCPLGGESYKTLPDWMKRYMTTTSDFLPTDVARSINHLFSLALLNKESLIYEGREDLERRIAVDVQTAPAKSGRPLNVILLTGLQGMGRGTVAKSLLSRAFPGMRAGGPVFDLADAADAVDWHLVLFEDLNGGMTAYEMARQIDAFPIDDPVKAAEVLQNSLIHWADLNQVIILRSRWGLRERVRMISPWASNLFKRLEATPNIKLVIISDRKLPPERITDFPNVRQYDVDELPDQTIAYILSKSIEPKFLRAETLDPVAQKVHGHPATANHVAFLVNSGMSLDSLSQYPTPIYTFQDKVLEGIYKSGTLTEVQGKLLRLLSWLP